MKNKERGRVIRHQIVRDVPHHPDDLAKHTGNIFSISPQAVYRHLKKLETDNRIRSTGRGKGKRYFLGDVRRNSSLFRLDGSIEEDRIWRDHFAFIFDDLPENLIDICHYGFTEIVNNAIDHSGGTVVAISGSRSEDSLTISIADDGEGIFCRIKRLCKLSDERQAVFELSKGKLTTDPDHHTGEGIFFTSRAFDFFEINSKGLTFSHRDGLHFDYIVESALLPEPVGTSASMIINRKSDRTLQAVFDDYTEGPTEFGFDKTVVPVRLAQYGTEKLVSRSQAKRVLARIEKFKRVVFDFEGVISVGQAFADEIFRVYANKNPEIVMVPVYMTQDVEKMVKRAMQARISGKSSE